MSKRHGKKVPSIINRTVIKEKIIFRGKKIIREKVVKEFVIPKIIKDDIGFQLMFGMTSPSVNSVSKSSGGIEECYFLMPGSPSQ